MAKIDAIDRAVVLEQLAKNELIEKAAALEAVECLIEAAESARDPTGRKALEMARDAIMDLPAVKDVEQKVYARWEYFHEHNWNKKATIDGYYRCPNACICL